MKNADKSIKLSAKQRKIRLTIKASAILLVLIFFVYGFSMQTVKYTVDSEKINEKIKIVFVSDLHNCFYGGTDQSKLTDAIRQANPDLVMLGGDIIDEYGGTQHAMTLVKEISDEYICCYAPGNHEMMRDDLEEFEQELSSKGVHVLDGAKESFNVNGQNVTVYGVLDSFQWGQSATVLEELIPEIDENSYNILLAHQPEQIDTYLTGDFDLILSGHAHGGQWRFPIILEQGFWAPDQGLRPKYTNGMFEHEDSVHIISKGLARPLRMILIPRIYNRPEFTIIEIE